MNTEQILAYVEPWLDQIYGIGVALIAEPEQLGLAAIALAGGYYFLNRKSRAARDADERVDEIRAARADHYHKTRIGPPA